MPGVRTCSRPPHGMGLSHRSISASSIHGLGRRRHGRAHAATEDSQAASTSGRTDGITAMAVGHLTRDDESSGTSAQPTAPSKSVVDALLQPLQSILGTDASTLDLPAVQPVMEPVPNVVVAPLPAKNLGTLQGGQWPFTYDPVYGLPVVNEVWSYGKVLRGIREGRIKQLLWFLEGDHKSGDVVVTGRCLVKLRDGRVAQSVVPQEDLRIQEALKVHGVPTCILPPEPRHVGPLDAPLTHPYARWYRENIGYMEGSNSGRVRRGPQVAPTEAEMLVTLPEFKEARQQVIEEEQTLLQSVLDDAIRLDTEEWNAYVQAGPSVGRMGMGEEALMDEGMNYGEETKKKSWMDNITVSQDMQAMIVRYVPILGPIVGSAFIIGLYMLSRLVKGDLTDRMNMMNQEEDKRKRQQLKEARIAFLEEEMPALVAKGATMEEIRKKAANVNSKLGTKYEISESELQSTYEACTMLLQEGADISGGAKSSSAADRILAEEDARQAEAARQAGSEDGGQQKSDLDQLMDMGKLNTARIRKATDPKIMEVKRRVRQARRALKRESKVQLTDEIIFFDDVAGNEQAKVELLEIVDFFRQPQKFRASGARAPKGVLLVGTPGNGKTLMARAVAGESGVAFISCSASEFIEMYMGLGAARVRDVFQQARKLAPCIIFIDELDAVGRARRGAGGGNDERDNTVNQLLTELDGFEAEQQGIVVMGATNRKDVLDAALTRPGRFDRSIEVRRPDFQGRLEGVKVHLRDVPLGPDVDFKALAMLTGGMSGAQLAGMCNISSFIASRSGRSEVTQEDLVKAIEQSKYGKTYDQHRFVSPARKRRLAVVEAGICVTATLLPAIEDIDYVTALPSSKSPVGRTVLKSDYQRYTTGLWTRRYLSEQLLVALAGRAAEEIVYGFDEMSSLHQYRLMFARQIATKMLNAGMSEHPDFKNLRSLGDQYYEPSSEPGRFTLFTNTHDTNQTRSEWVDVDMELEALLNNSYARVKDLLLRNRAALDHVVEMLLEQDRVEGEEVEAAVVRLAAKQDLSNLESTKELALL